MPTTAHQRLTCLKQKGAPVAEQVVLSAQAQQAWSGPAYPKKTKDLLLIALKVNG